MLEANGGIRDVGFLLARDWMVLDAVPFSLRGAMLVGWLVSGGCDEMIYAWFFSSGLLVGCWIFRVLFFSLGGRVRMRGVRTRLGF